MSLLTTFSLLLYCLDAASGNDLVVQVSEGRLRGKQVDPVYGYSRYLAFQCIPYATPPVGALRFKDPLPAAPWRGVRDARGECGPCVQRDPATRTSQGCEDCLHLHVYTPTLKPKTPMCVLFYIHEGYFTIGSASPKYYNPEILVSKNVVVVTLNYRLGPLGFLSSGCADAPGNAGLKDQVLAMKWVKRNIHIFGGDPNCVTIKGLGAGAVSVGLHAVSPMSKDLFQRGILLAGSPLSSWTHSDEAQKRALALAKSVGCEAKDVKSALCCLREVPAHQLANATANVLPHDEPYSAALFAFNEFAPSVEGDHGNERFLPKPVIKLLESGKLNGKEFLTGYTDQTCKSLIPEIKKVLKLYNKYRILFCPRDLAVSVCPEAAQEAAQKIVKYYFGDKCIDEQSVPQFVRFANAAAMEQDTLRLAARLAQRGRPLYFFTFGMQTGWNHRYPASEQYNITGASPHDMRLYTLPDPTVNKSPPSCEDRQIIEFCSTLCSNFVYTGNPTPDSSLGITWPLYDLQHTRYLIADNKPQIGCDPAKDSQRFWKSVYEEAGCKNY